MKKYTFARILAAMGLLGALTIQPATAQKVTGAIFTTTYNGAVVNANLYDSKCDVYLDGGPGPNAPQKAAGLPAGEYYFQVTDPSGAVLLSSDPAANRKFRVANGVIVEYLGDGASAPHPTGYDLDHGDKGAITIGLANLTCPTDYLTTPNEGGVYKVWVTPVGDFQGDPSQIANSCGGGCFHGFRPSSSKTDNFKVEPTISTFCLRVNKEMSYAGGAEGTYEPEPGWLIQVTGPDNVDNFRVTAGEDGGVYGQAEFCGLTPGDYIVREETPEGYEVGGLIVNGVAFENPEPIYSFQWNAGDPEPEITFQNYETGGIGPL